MGNIVIYDWLILSTSLGSTKQKLDINPEVWTITCDWLTLTILIGKEEEDTQEREVWLLHRMLLSVTKDHDSQARSGTLTLKYKTMRTFYLDIIGADKFQLLQTTLESLVSINQSEHRWHSH